MSTTVVAKACEPAEPAVVQALVLFRFAGPVLSRMFRHQEKQEKAAKKRRDWTCKPPVASQVSSVLQEPASCGKKLPGESAERRIHAGHTSGRGDRQLLGAFCLSLQF